MFLYKNDTLYCEGIPLPALSQKYGTPLYVYSAALLDDAIDKVKGAFSVACPWGLCCYAVKANSHLSLIKYLSSKGLGFDIVSHGEMLRVLEAQGHLNNVVYSGSAKSTEDITEAVKNGVFMLNAESLWELHQASKAGQLLNKQVSVSLRVNPSVDPRTHKNISTGVRGAKFGISFDEIPAAAAEAISLPNIRLEGLSCHIGSMVDGAEPFLQMLSVLTKLVKDLQEKGITLKYLDLGGGFPINYTTETEIDYPALFSTYQKALEPLNLIPIIEPGRSIIGKAGVLLTKVIHIKESFGRNFAFIDAGFTELIRPALYNAVHSILPVQKGGTVINCTVAGPICESTDVFAEDIPLAVKENALLVIENTGAYGASMASNYNTRPSCAEVFVRGTKDTLITKSSGYSALWQTEEALPL